MDDPANRALFRDGKIDARAITCHRPARDRWKGAIHVKWHLAPLINRCAACAVQSIFHVEATLGNQRCPAGATIGEAKRSHGINGVATRVPH
jgi:hypothetical protein